MVLILLVDDDEEEFDIFKNALRLTNTTCTCIYAAGGEEAIAWLGKIKPALIIIDYNMPRLNGIECLKKIKTLPGMNTVPIILYSTGMNDKISVDALDKGASACVQKPDNVNKLARIITSFFTAFNLLEQSPK
jgi:CheY-like chemotaxis protein